MPASPLQVSLMVFQLLCLREGSISLPSTFSDAAQFAHFLPNLLHLPAQLLQDGLQDWETSPLASGRDPWHTLKSGTWRAAATLCGSLCPSRGSCFYTFWGNCSVTTTSKTVTAPQFQCRPPYFTLPSHPTAQTDVSAGCSQGRSLPNTVPCPFLVRENCIKGSRNPESAIACKLPRNENEVKQVYDAVSGERKKRVYMENQGHWVNTKKQASCLMKFDSQCMGLRRHQRQLW